MNELETVLSERIIRLELAVVRLIAMLQPETLTREQAEKLGAILKEA